MQVEIVGAVLLQVDRVDAQRHGRADIGATACDSVAAPDAERGKRIGDPGLEVIGAVRQLEIDLPDVVRAEIRFHRQHMVCRAMRLRIGDAAEQPDFFGTEPDDADGALRLAGVHHQLGRGSGDRDASTVIDRAGAQIPAVEMPADQDYACLWIAARHLGDDIARLGGADLARGEHQLHLHRLTGL